MPLLFCAVAPVFAAEGSMTPAERTYLLEQLTTSKQAMLASIQGLSADQWAFKPAPAVWSVKECAEHIILAEDYIFGATQQILKSPAVPRPAGSNEEMESQAGRGRAGPVEEGHRARTDHALR